MSVWFGLCSSPVVSAVSLYLVGCCHSKETVMFMSCSAFLTSESTEWHLSDIAQNLKNHNRKLWNYWSTFWEGAITLIQVLEWFHHLKDGHTPIEGEERSRHASSSRNVEVIVEVHNFVRSEIIWLMTDKLDPKIWAWHVCQQSIPQLLKVKQSEHHLSVALDLNYLGRSRQKFLWKHCPWWIGMRHSIMTLKLNAIITTENIFITTTQDSMLRSMQDRDVTYHFFQSREYHAPWIHSPSLIHKPSFLFRTTKTSLWCSVL